MLLFHLSLASLSELRGQRWVGQNASHSEGGAGVHTVTEQCGQVQRDGHFVKYDAIPLQNSVEYNFR